MFKDVLVYVPGERMLITIAEGTGDNLLREDIEEGFRDYVMYEFLDVPDALEGRTLEGDDGGMLMYKELVQEKFNSLEDAVPGVLRDIFGETEIKYQVL